MKRFIFWCVFISIMFGFISGSLVAYHYNNKCKSYEFDKGALFTTQGVFCERTVHSSWEVPFLPLEGAKRQFHYLHNPDPRYKHAPTPEMNL